MKIIALFFLLFLRLSDVNAQFRTTETIYPFPKPIGYVNDFDTILNPITIHSLTNLIVDHESKTSNQIAIVTIPTYAPYDNLKDYGMTLANTWGVGQKGKNNGVIIFVCKEKRVLRIAVGRGLENILTEALCLKIIEEKMKPRFKEGNYNQGVLDGLLEVIRILEGN